jgi:hypothetical protein
MMRSARDAGSAAQMLSSILLMHDPQDAALTIKCLNMVVARTSGMLQGFLVRLWEQTRELLVLCTVMEILLFLCYQLSTHIQAGRIMS